MIAAGLYTSFLLAFSWASPTTTLVPKREKKENEDKGKKQMKIQPRVGPACSPLLPRPSPPPPPGAAARFPPAPPHRPPEETPDSPSSRPWYPSRSPARPGSLIRLGRGGGRKGPLGVSTRSPSPLSHNLLISGVQRRHLMKRWWRDCRSLLPHHQHSSELILWILY